MKKTNNFDVSVIIPTYNEAKYIVGCIESLLLQTYKVKEIIVVDDGSTDDTSEVIKKSIIKKKVRLLIKNHSGPGESRNLGANTAKSEILVFVDADMIFDSRFIEKLTLPIRKNGAVGTFTTEEFLANPDNFWAKNWNMGRFISAKNFTKDYLKHMVPNTKNLGTIFRSILKKYFDEVSGFESGGDYSDDETLQQRLNISSVKAEGAILYHYNPATFNEVWNRALWIGSDKKFNKNLVTQVFNLVKFSFPASLAKSIYVGATVGNLSFVPFKIVYDLGIWVAIIRRV